METGDNLYGDNAIVGNKDDALKTATDHNAEVKTSTTTTIKMGEETPQEQPQEQPQDQPQEQEDGTTPEQQLENDIKNQVQADTDVKNDLESKGVDFNKLAQEYETTGQLSTESVEALTKAGYPKSVVDAYIAGMEATAAKFEAQVYEYAGGKQEFQKLTQFVQSQGQESIDTFNRVVGTGDLATIKLALQGFQAQMTKAYGSTNRTVMGKATTGTSNGFQSKAEMVTAMSDKRYGRDPGYTMEIQNKTMRSSFLI